ncbi:MAG: adenylate/guanylate cyclase domain-containing protein, partial [Acidimicrobiia bacterium]
MIRLPQINGASVIANSVILATLLFVNGETAVGWTVVALGITYLLAVVVFIVTGRAALYIHGVLWPSLVQNIAAHVMLGGFVWSGATLFWGIIVSVIAALFLGRRPGTIIAGAYVVAAVVFAFLEPTLQARRSQPALAVSVGMAVDVFVLSVLIMVPIVISLMSQVIGERARSEGLLLNVLPRVIAERLKRSPGIIADAHDSCTVSFADLVGFTDHTTRAAPEQVVSELNHVFSRFDALAGSCGAEKIKTMGDGYLAVAGCPNPRPDHAAVMCDLALRMQEAMPEINRELGSSFQLRIGLHTGPLVAGVVGAARFSYDLWGHTVNLASRMETMCPPGRIQVTEAVALA